MPLSEIEKKDGLGEDLSILIENFEFDLQKSTLISKLQKKHLDHSFVSPIKEILENIQKTHGVENIAKSQSIVMIVTAFEVFSKNLFKILLIHKNDLLKKALRKCDKLKIDSEEIIKILNGKKSWGEVIIDSENLSFQRISSFEKSFRMIDLEFEDLLEEAKVDCNNFLLEKNPSMIISENGIDLFGKLLDQRHQIVHESKDFEVSSSEFNTYLVFFQFLVLLICDRFKSVKVYQIMHDSPSEKTPNPTSP